MAACPFCPPDPERVFHEGQLAVGLWDAMPVSPGHALLVARRHVTSWFEASEPERAELMAGVEIARRAIERLHRPDGYNVGINVGAAAGQTVFHLHVHVIPRYLGDRRDPRGGVRHALPGDRGYPRLSPGASIGPGSPGGAGSASEHLDPDPDPRLLVRDAPHDRGLIVGGADPLLPHVEAHLARASRADLAVAFVLRSGIELLAAHFAEFLARGGRLRLLTGDYLGVTDPAALTRLLDLAVQYPEHAELRVFEAADGSFHPKSYVFHDGAGGGVALVGSSNLTRPALTDGVEWNVRTITPSDRRSFDHVVRGFDTLFSHPRTRVLDEAWIAAYCERRPVLRTTPQRDVAPPDEAPDAPAVPHAIQREALAALEATRRAGNTAGLVVLATGLGKTWLSAFDSTAVGARRVLFVAHREEILRQSLATFRRIRPEARLGLYNGQEKVPDADVVFASIQTLGRARHLARFAPDSFDYLVMDEFHHAAAPTYRRVIDHFEPRFLLGLTATPERTDGGDLLALCQENLVFRCDLARGIDARLLAPFHYFGVPDEVDYANIPWRSNRFDEAELTKAVATQERAQNALEQYQQRAGSRTLGFCCSMRHADFMREFFAAQGYRAAAVHSGEHSDPRALSLEQLEQGELDIVFAVDMLNEGVDIPHVDTVMMLRPTESRILWLQQFGRGLRRADDKPHLTVIDYIGNHRTFLLKPQTLFALPTGDAHVAALLDRLRMGEAELPAGCEVTYELEAVEILRGLLRDPTGQDVLKYAYQDFRERMGARPTATEMHHEGAGPRRARAGHGSWLRFVQSMGGLTADERDVLDAGAVGELLDRVETTQMTKSYKMVVLRAMLDAEAIPGELTLDRLREGVRRIARRSGALRDDFDARLEDDADLRRLLEQNPIAAWTGGRGTGGRSFFAYDDGVFRTTFSVPEQQRSAFAGLLRELVDWRLAEYLDRESSTPESATEEVSAERAVTPFEIGRSYMRKEIAEAAGLVFNTGSWNAGYVHQGGLVFLLVTLQSADMPEGFRYADRFLAPDLFEWKSQNRQQQRGGPGQLMRHHEERGVPVHLFVRKRKTHAGHGAPFVACGPVTFESWEGEKPITIRWRLAQPINDRMADLFEVTPGE